MKKIISIILMLCIFVLTPQVVIASSFFEEGKNTAEDIYTVYIPSVLNNYSNEVTIQGKVVDSLDIPVEGILIYISQSGFRYDVHSDINGEFSVTFPKTDNPTWFVSAVGINCTSRVMDPETCRLSGFFHVNTFEVVTIPQSEPIIFVFEIATTVIKGNLVDNTGTPLSDKRIFGYRSDGAMSWGATLEDGTFEIPASDGTWNVYAVDFSTDDESNHVSVTIENGISVPETVSLEMP